MKILLATDGSKDAVHAREMLSNLALRPPTEIAVLSVVPMPQLVAPGVGIEGELRATAPSASEVDAARETAEKAAHALEPVARADSLVEVGPPADVICRIAEERKVDLVVMGSRGLSGVRRFLIGSVSAQVLRNAPCSVLIARPLRTRIKNVLVGVDGSTEARQAVHYLSRFPVPSDARITVVGVIHLPCPFYGNPALETPEARRAIETVQQAAEAEAQSALTEAADVLKGSFTVETKLVSGTPAAALLDLAETLASDLMVVGSRGLSAIQHFVMGSVSLQVSQHSKIPVLVVRQGSAA